MQRPQDIHFPLDLKLPRQLKISLYLTCRGVLSSARSRTSELWPSHCPAPVPSPPFAGTATMPLGGSYDGLGTLPISGTKKGCGWEQELDLGTLYCPLSLLFLPLTSLLSSYCQQLPREPQCAHASLLSRMLQKAQLTFQYVLNSSSF